MRSPASSMSMLREHDDIVSLTSYSAPAGNEHSVDAIHSPKQQHQFVLNPQQPSSNSTHHTNYCPASPEARMSTSTSMSKSGSIHSTPRSSAWNSAMPSSPSPYPAETASASVHTPPAPDTHAYGPRAEAGRMAESYKEGHTHLSWAGEVPSDGRKSRSVHDGPATVTVWRTLEAKERDSSAEPNAVLVLLLFSTPIPFFSFCTSIYTLLALLIVIFTTPLRLCPPTSFFRSTTFSTQLCKLLVPALRKHERLAQSSKSDYQHNSSPYNNDTTTTTTIDQFSALWLIAVLILAPFLCLGLLLAVWIAAFFWIFAMILGNPDGTEKGDDGRAAVLGVNAWWQTWLDKSRVC